MLPHLWRAVFQKMASGYLDDLVTLTLDLAFQQSEVSVSSWTTLFVHADINPLVFLHFTENPY